MKNMSKPELLSPVGDFDCLKSAVQNGADSIYLGADLFNARARATNFNKESLKEAVKYAKLRNVKVNLALNTLIKNEEFDEAVNLAIYAYNIGVDSIIIQDLGLATYLRKNYPEIILHGSTQMTVHNLDGAKLLENLGFSRVVLARELNIKEIEYIRKNTNIELEVFIHGALCISYSGACLLSSMIGGRSGNRGMCAQSCRLPYTLVDSKDNKIDSGYLLSTRDLCGLEYLPSLIKMGINTFKIEGRLKNPIYVGVVTRIYRKYIDLVYSNVNLSNAELIQLIQKESINDKKELLQVFNRGNLSTGHFSENGNKELIYKEQSRNKGIYLGKVLNFNNTKGHITLNLDSSLAIGDKIRINENLYNVSEIMVSNKNYKELPKGSKATIGRMKGNIRINNEIYKMESKTLNESVLPTFLENKEFKKVHISAKILVKRNEPIKLTIWSNDGFYSGMEYSLQSEILPITATSKPISKEKIIEQISKTGNTEFIFDNIEVNLDNGLFISKISVFNELRRKALENLEKMVIQKYSRNLEFLSNVNQYHIKNNNTNLIKDNKIGLLNNDASTNLLKDNKINSLNNVNTDLLKNNHTVLSKNINNESIQKTKEISLLLNILDENTNYSSLKNIQNIYIPFKYFINYKFENIIKEFCNSFNTYIYMPIVLKDNYFDINSLIKKIVNTFNIKGAIISHISQISLFEKYKLDLVGNYSLNICNSNAINYLENLCFKKYTPSVELNEIELNEILGYSSTIINSTENIDNSLNNNNNLNINTPSNSNIKSTIQSELIVYGKIPVMTNNYCFLGKSNKCYKECSKKCTTIEKYSLKDRYGFKFRIIPDNMFTTTTIYNNRNITTSYQHLNPDSIRIDILDENIEDIQNCVDKFMSKYIDKY